MAGLHCLVSGHWPEGCNNIKRKGTCDLHRIARKKPVLWRVWPMAGDKEATPALQHDLWHSLGNFLLWKRHVAFPPKIVQYSLSPALDIYGLLGDIQWHDICPAAIVLTHEWQTVEMSQPSLRTFWCIIIGSSLCTVKNNQKDWFGSLSSEAKYRNFIENIIHLRTF